MKKEQDILDYIDATYNERDNTSKNSCYRSMLQERINTLNWVLRG